MKKKVNIFIAAILICSCSDVKEVDTSVYLDASQSVENRVDALLSQMTLSEKIGQMDMVAIWDRDRIVKQ